MQSEMSPDPTIVKFLKLKLEVVYRGLSIEEARQRFDELKKEETPVVKQTRKLKK
jgi:hypothetical protein